MVPLILTIWFMLTHFMKIRLLYLVTSLSLFGCAEYSFDINDNEIYRPAELYTDFSVTDPALQACIEQTIRDGKFTSPTQVRVLQCTFSGIKNLTGIDQFSRLEQLGLKGNEISEIETLLQLTYLFFLDLTDNPVSDCQTLGQLENLITENLIHSTECTKQ